AAYAASPDGSKLRGQALGAAYNAMENSLRRGVEAQGHAHGTPGYTAALGRAIASSTPDRQRAAAAVGVGLLGTGEAEALTCEEWEAYVNQTDNLARTQGIRHDAAFGAIRGMMATPAAVAHRTPGPIGGGATLANSIETAARAVACMKEQRVPPAALGAEGFAGHVYNLAINDAAGHNNLTPQRIFGALRAAQVTGFNNISDADAQLAETMLDANPDVGGWAAGDINAYNMGVARQVVAAGGAGTQGSKRVCQRVIASGRGINEMTVAAASRAELNGSNAAQAGFAVASMVDAYDADPMVEALRTGGHDANGYVATQIRGLPGSTVHGYATLAREAPGIAYGPEIVNEAVALQSGGYGRVGDMAGRISRVVGVALDGGGNINAHTAGVGLQRVVGGGFVRSTWDDPNVLNAAANFTDAQLNDADFMAAAKHGAVILPNYTPDHISHLASIAGAAGVTVGQVTSSAYGAVLDVVPVGTNAASVISRRDSIHGIVLANAAADAGGLTGPDRDVFVHNAAVLSGHRDFGALSGPTYQRAVTLAGGWAQAMYEQGQGRVDDNLQGMSPDIRRVIVAVAENGGNAVMGLNGVTLTDYVSTVGRVVSDLGLRDHGQAVRLVGDALVDPGTHNFDAGRLGNVTARVNYLHAGGWTGGMTDTQFEVIDRYVAPAGVAPTKQIVERVIQFQSMNAGTAVTTEIVNVLANAEVARHDFRTVAASIGTLQAVAAARIDPTGGPVDAARLNQELQSLPADDVRTILTIQRNGGTGGATGQHLLNVVAAVNAVGNDATQAMIQSVVNLPAARLAQPEAGAMIARAAEFSTPANLANNVQTMTYMVNNCGYSVNQIGAGDIGLVEQVYGVVVGGEHVVPRREFVTKLVQSGVPLNAQNIAIASLPAIASLRAHELPGAVNAVNQYLGAPDQKMFNSVDVLQVEDQFLNTLVAIERVRDAQQCANIQYAEAQYVNNLQYPPNRNEFTTNVNGMQVRVT
ncbi:MAG: hypothetical protein C5B53_12165, partial [Candidatus Melainabacteria bacterium]